MWSLSNLLVIALGGALGAVSRWGLSEFVKAHWAGGFWGILTVNLLGCFLIGLAMHLATAVTLSPRLSIFLVMGFLGAFTTFSTFALENFELLRDGRFLASGGYMLLSTVGGVALVCVGWVVGHQLHAMWK